MLQVEAGLLNDFLCRKKEISARPVMIWKNLTNPGNGYTLFNNEHYVRGVDGKELATYTNNSLDEWYVWGTDMVGKIRANTNYYFFKDHLGSVRGVIDNNFNLVSATDYDMWGCLMGNRVYNGDSAKHKFTGKERDEENLYDYFGARYYDSRIGRWTQVEPLLERYIKYSSYCYGLDNPINLIDIDGNVIILSTQERTDYFNDVISNYFSSVYENNYNEILKIIGNASNFDLAITDYEPEVEFNTGELAAGVDKINLKELSTGKNYKNILGIRLLSGFFESGNKYISAMYLEHELFHIDFYYRELGLKTGSAYMKWKKNNSDKYKAHELDAIRRSRNKTTELYNKGYISEDEYNKANERWDEYESEINDL